MKNNNKKRTNNYLEFIPVRNEQLMWDSDDSQMVTIYIENKGIMKRITQRLLKKPNVSQIHLEKYGSFIWKEIDGKHSILEIADKADKKFGEELHPLYERISSYFSMLESGGFVTFREDTQCD